jgi:hypothetical protein
MPRATGKHRPLVAAFRDGLQKVGWTEGHNIRIDSRWAAEVELMQQFAKELVALQPDLILSQTTPTTAALLRQTRTIPIVFARLFSASPWRCALADCWRGISSDVYCWPAIDFFAVLSGGFFSCLSLISSKPT